MTKIKENNPPFSIEVKDIGPIRTLNGNLSSSKQNLVLARNGAGKSFIARALSSLNNTADSNGDNDVCTSLVSEESTSGVGKLALYCGEECIGGLELDTNSKTINYLPSNFIYHVFSLDYVDQHLRNKLDNLNGNITHEIIVGKENVEIDLKMEKLSEIEAEISSKFNSLSDEFYEKRIKHKEKFGINAQLSEYKNLDVNVYLRDIPFSLNSDIKPTTKLLAEYEQLISLPANPQFPGQLDDLVLEICEKKICADLVKTTSPSVVADAFKAKIESDDEFFKRGVQHYRISPQECPFCTQELSEIAVNAISAYCDYFNDNEAQEKANLKEYVHQVDTEIEKIRNLTVQYSNSKTNYDNLKLFFPSLESKSSVALHPSLDNLNNYLKSMKTAIEEKIRDLTKPVDCPTGNIEKNLLQIQEVLQANNSLFNKLEKIVDKRIHERLRIQNQSCQAFENEFYHSKTSHIEQIRELSDSQLSIEKEIAKLQNESGESAPARARVVQTFSELLSRFFGIKYTFDEDTFKIQHNNMQMARGSDKTLSDGEKSALAFCYFLAQMHLQVQSNEDYEKLFLIFDDPVNSMSFEYIYKIVHILKCIRIGPDTQIEFNTNSEGDRPVFLILTHNHIFFNTLKSNRVVQDKGLFQLVAGETKHSLKCQTGFATPHLLQLQDVYDVSHGRKIPDHTTANSIRSVLESIWRFCQPNIDNFSEFLRSLIEELEIEINSILVNDFSHGGKYDEPMFVESDIIDAANDTIKIVNVFAKGQIDQLAD